jgi:hypothetical protein
MRLLLIVDNIIIGQCTAVKLVMVEALAESDIGVAGL